MAHRKASLSCELAHLLVGNLRDGLHEHVTRRHAGVFDYWCAARHIGLPLFHLTTAVVQLLLPARRYRWAGPGATTATAW
jgi:hypothetical protein